MTTLKPLDTIAVTSSTTDGLQTMMKTDRVTAMNALHVQGHSATKIGKLLGGGRKPLQQKIRMCTQRARRLLARRGIEPIPDIVQHCRVPAPQNLCNPLCRVTLAIRNLHRQDFVRSLHRIRTFRDRHGDNYGIGWFRGRHS